MQTARSVPQLPFSPSLSNIYTYSPAYPSSSDKQTTSEAVAEVVKPWFALHDGLVTDGCDAFVFKPEPAKCCNILGRWLPAWSSTSISSSTAERVRLSWPGCTPFWVSEGWLLETSWFILLIGRTAGGWDGGFGLSTNCEGNDGDGRWARKGGERDVGRLVGNCWMGMLHGRHEIVAADEHDGGLKGWRCGIWERISPPVMALIWGGLAGALAESPGERWKDCKGEIAVCWIAVGWPAEDNVAAEGCLSLGCKLNWCVCWMIPGVAAEKGLPKGEGREKGSDKNQQRQQLAEVGRSNSRTFFWDWNHSSDYTI